MCSLVVLKGLTEILECTSAEEQCLLNKSGDGIGPEFSSYFL